MYMFAPRFSHRFVGYLEEEAVHTYTKCLQALDSGKLPIWASMKAPEDAINYYGLDPDCAKLRDVLLSVRADEACHRSVNHHCSDIPSYYAFPNEEIAVVQKGLSFRVDDAKRVSEFNF